MSSGPADQVPSAAPHGLPLHHSHVPLTAFKLEVGKKNQSSEKMQENLQVSHLKRD